MRALRLTALAALVALVSSVALGPLAAQPVEEPTGQVLVTAIDTSQLPRVALEVSVPASLLGEAPEQVSVRLWEDGRVLPSELTQVAASGLEVVMLIDVSGSMNEGNALSLAQDAAIGFLEALPSTVPVGVVAFGDAPQLVSPLTTDRRQLEASIRLLAASGETALYDAMVFAERLFSGGTDDRQLVVLSDGGDTVSAASLDDAVRVGGIIRTSVIELVSSESNREALNALTEARNGTLSSAADPNALAALYRDVASVLVSRYRVTTESSAVGPVTYRLQVLTATGSFETTAAADLPDVPPPTTAPPTSTVPDSSQPDTSVPGTTAPPASQPGAGTADDEPWMSGSALLWIGSVLLFAALLLVGLIVLGPRARAAVDRGRLARGSGQASRPERATAEHQSVAERLTHGVERLLEPSGRRARLSTRLERAGSPLRAGEFVVIVLAGGVALALLLAQVLGLLGLLIAVGVGMVVPQWYLTVKTDRRRRAFTEQLPDVLQLMVSSLRSGYGLPQALEAAATQSNEPARSEFERVQFEIRIGRDPGDALAAAAARMSSREFDWVVAAMAINREVGGELAPVLESLGEAVRERLRLQRQIRTLTAEGRISAYVLTILPVALVVLLGILSPGYFDPMTRAPGPLLFGIAGVLMLLGWIWMRRLIRSHM